MRENAEMARLVAYFETAFIHKHNDIDEKTMTLITGFHPDVLSFPHTNKENTASSEWSGSDCKVHLFCCFYKESSTDLYSIRTALMVICCPLLGRTHVAVVIKR